MIVWRYAIGLRGTDGARCAALALLRSAGGSRMADRELRELLVPRLGPNFHSKKRQKIDEKSREFSGIQ